MEKKLKAAVVGFGRMGHVHASQYEKQDNVKLVAVCDINPDALVASLNTKRGEVKHFNRIHTYTSFADLLAGEPDLDIIDICLPTSLHMEYSIKAMKAGKNVLCEKPMALSSKQCDKMIEVSKQTGKFLMIAQCLRFNSQYVFIADAIKKNKYGKLLQMELHRNNTMQTGWFLDVKQSGGALMDLHLHDIDFVQFALGMPESVYAIGVPAGSGGIDDCLAIYYYKNGLKVISQGSWTRGQFSSNMSAVFEKGNLELLGNELTKNHMHDPIKKIDLPDEGNMYFREIAYFAQCVKTRKAPKIATMESTRNSILLIEKELKSIATGKPVKL